MISALYGLRGPALSSSMWLLVLRWFRWSRVDLGMPNAIVVSPLHLAVYQWFSASCRNAFAPWAVFPAPARGNLRSPCKLHKYSKYLLLEFFQHWNLKRVQLEAQF